jgi:hypothetical protein
MPDDLAKAIDGLWHEIEEETAAALLEYSQQETAIVKRLLCTPAGKKLVEERKALDAERSRLKIDEIESKWLTLDGKGGRGSTLYKAGKIRRKWHLKLDRWHERCSALIQAASEPTSRLTVAQIAANYIVDPTTVTRFCKANESATEGIERIGRSWTMTPAAIAEAAWKLRITSKPIHKEPAAPKKKPEILKCDRCGDTSHAKRFMSPCECGGNYKRFKSHSHAF